VFSSLSVLSILILLKFPLDFLVLKTVSTSLDR
jgi:hypothetical protein